VRRPLYAWLVFCLCLAVASAAVAWATVVALRLDRSEAVARRQAAFEEDVRLALWRMDSAIAPVIARENSRPYFAYSAFYPAGAVYTRMFAPVDPGAVMLPSPILAEKPQYVLLHFQFDPQGVISSPQVPTGSMRDVAEARHLIKADLDKSAVLLAGFAEAGSLAELESRLPGAKRASGKMSGLAMNRVTKPGPDLTDEEISRMLHEGSRPQRLQQQAARSQNRGLAQQVEINADEYQARQQSITNNNSIAVASQYAQNIQAPPQTVEVSAMTPLWIGPGDRLVLARRLTIGGAEYVQGCLIDWTALQKELVASVSDTFPGARLEPVRETGSLNGARMLAAIPAAFVPGPVPQDDNGALSPLKIALMVVWASLLLAAGAIGALLGGAITLGERRGAFVSAVTHELRTPLTTFRIYTEMLAEGMVPDEAAKREYLATLRLEAERLSHLVENVLAYSRLERNRAGGPVEIMTVHALVDRAMPHLVARAKEAGMEVVVDGGAASTQSSPETLSRPCSTDACVGDNRRGDPVGRPVSRRTVADLQKSGKSVSDSGGSRSTSRLGRIRQCLTPIFRTRAAAAPTLCSSRQAGDLSVAVDASAVEQILFNLVDNAAKYASSSADKRITISSRSDGRFAAIAVSDHGPGISKRDARKLFRPFSKSARDAANSAPGVGLGLALCRRIARRLGGDLRLEKSAQGAAFVLTLPLAQ
jgi:signal transduction histidine kinase